jgi:hypothetical protein
MHEIMYFFKVETMVGRIFLSDLFPTIVNVRDIPKLEIEYIWIAQAFVFFGHGYFLLDAILNKPREEGEI